MTRKEINKIVNDRCAMLEQGTKNIETIYHIIFNDPEWILAETNDGYRITKYTYGQVEKMIDQATAALYERIGENHTYVALEMENHVNWIVAFWAILKSGNKPYLVNCRHPKKLTEGILETLNIKYIIGNDETNLKGEFIDVNSLLQEQKGENSGETYTCPARFENELALSTSATSMKEVICFYTGEELAEQIMNVKGILRQSRRISLHDGENLKQLAFLPFYHVFGLVAVYLWFTYFGRTFVFLKDYSGDTILKTCRKHGVTHIFSVPMLWHTIEKQLTKKVHDMGEKKEKKFYKGLRICTKLQNIFPYWGAKMSMKIMKEVTSQLFGDSVKFCISGGSYLKDSAMYMFNGMGYAMHNGYGMSEIGITSVEMRDKPKDRNKNSVGMPFEHAEYRISEKGTLQVKGSFMSKRILVNGEEIKTPEWFDTGDLMTEKEGHYYVQGRVSDTVIGESGENINPDVIEQYFDLPEAESYSVLGLEKNGSQHLAMVVQIKSYLPYAKIETMIHRIYETNKELPMASWVQDFYVTYDPLYPPTAVKVSRKQLQNGIENGSIQLMSFQDLKEQKASEGNKEGQVYNQELAKIVRQVICTALQLQESELGDDTHLMQDLDVSSLQYFSVLAALDQEFSITNYSQTDNYCYTVREFTDYIEKHL